MKPIALAMLFVTFITVNALALEPDVIIYPRPLSSGDTRFEYHLSLLEEALRRTTAEYGPFELRPTHVVMNQLRQFDLLDQGSPQLDVAIKPTSVEREKLLTPVRIPLGKGLVGWRILLVHKTTLPALERVTSLDDLKRFRFGQGLGWSDIGILEHNGLTVVTGGNYEGLFAMLLSQRFDLFPRSVNEAYTEWDERHAELPHLRVDETLLLHYPFARYFWTANSKRGERLRERITKGLESMIRDGTFDARFQAHYGPVIRRAQLDKRRLIRLENPDLPPLTPLNRKELWFNPFDEPAAPAKKR